MYGKIQRYGDMQWRQIFRQVVMALVNYYSAFNSLAPVGFDYSRKLVNFKLISTINILSISFEIAIRSMLQHLTNH